MGFFHQFLLTQISAVLVGEDEKSSASFVFSFNADTTLREEVSGQTFQDAAAAASWVRTRISPALHLETADGTWADRLLLRNYADGTSVVLNLAADPRPRSLVAVTKAGRRNVELAPRGVLQLRSDWKPSGEPKPPQSWWGIPPRPSGVWRSRLPTRARRHGNDRMIFAIIGA